jgi:transposase
VPSVQLGPNALALLGTLAGQCHLTQRKIQAIFRDVFGISFSIGAISEAYEPVADALVGPTTELEQAIRQAPVKHADETTHQSHGHRLYLWAVVTNWGAHYKIQPSRAKWAAQALLGDELAGTIVTDRYAGYHWVDNSQRQVCWAHLLRDFARIANRPGWPGRIGHRLLGWGYLLFRWHGAHAHPGQWQRLQNHIRQALQAGASLTNECSRTANTCRNLLAIWESLWHFIRDPQIPPTNNLAERAIRSVVLRRKISYVTRSGRGMRFIERVFAVAYTCQRQGRSLYEYLCQVIDAHLFKLTFPSLVPSNIASR